MSLIDTHTHLYDEAFDADRDAVLARAAECGVERLLLPAIDSASHGRLFALTDAYPGVCLPMMGLHPASVNENPDFRNELALVESLLKNSARKFYAIGETGLDLYWSKDFLREQTEALRFQIELALRHDLPIVLHTRDAFSEMIAVVNDYRGTGLRGIFHSFAGTCEQYLELKDIGKFAFGIGGVVTYKNATIAKVANQMNLADIVLETDAPYLPPVP
ncbi:MAG: TatD family hydrolase, partial [Rikenellaceae bacterium]|nr:TatD family hydrolase [Rikenellaceae bacterium]